MYLWLHICGIRGLSLHSSRRNCFLLRLSLVLLHMEQHIPSLLDRTSQCEDNPLISVSSIPSSVYVTECFDTLGHNNARLCLSLGNPGRHNYYQCRPSKVLFWPLWTLNEMFSLWHLRLPVTDVGGDFT